MIKNKYNTGYNLIFESFVSNNEKHWFWWGSITRYKFGKSYIESVMS